MKVVNSNSKAPAAATETGAAAKPTTAAAKKAAGGAEVHAEREGRKTVFTRQIWDNLPAHKMGWKEITAAPKELDPDAGAGTGNEGADKPNIDEEIAAAIGKDGSELRKELSGRYQEIMGVEMPEGTTLETAINTMAAKLGAVLPKDAPVILPTPAAPLIPTNPDFNQEPIVNRPAANVAPVTAAPAASASTGTAPAKPAAVPTPAAKPAAVPTPRSAAAQANKPLTGNTTKPAAAPASKPAATSAPAKPAAPKGGSSDGK